MGVPHTNVYRMDNRIKKGTLQLGTFIRLAGCLGLTPTELMLYVEQWLLDEPEQVNHLTVLERIASQSPDLAFAYIRELARTGQLTEEVKRWAERNL